ncbi:hypothetical protein M4951_16240 [Blastopirellula sp. J2-11]|uniref:sodium:solute symporter family transporter n=1 Tax=Blastopirellula sp. J2-11 TaxID=2943192 RepID=UPI0021C6643D|nr:hypothetical protein [Blastopirellula sp. J2-11]UUO04930.1 hypothetical protein M4951_16240 [Blastopirellula sp. J2-11]
MPSILDIAIVLVYLIATIGVGLACRGRQQNDDDYFTAGGGFSQVFGALLVGLSIAATFFSGISLLAYPSVAYNNGPGIAIAALAIPLAGLPVLFWFLPKFLQHSGREPYGLIETQFGYPTRALASIMFILLRLGWMGTLIYAPTAALMAAFQLSQDWFWPIILTIGLSSTLYSAWGGLRGVIVTDAIQFLVLILGILWPIAHVFTHLPVSVFDFWSNMESSGEWVTLNTSIDMTDKRTVWSLLAGFFVSNVGIYMADQMSLQRYLASGTLRSARRAFVVNIVGVMVVTLLLTMLGVAMAAWYSQALQIAPEKVDDVFPRFVATILPPGAAGLIFAAILAATMSSMTSGVNSLAAAISLDFARHFNRDRTPQQALQFARRLSVTIGLLATATAGVVRHLGTIFDIAQSVIGVFLGPLLICMSFAVFQVRVSQKSMILGMLSGTLAGWVIIFSPCDSLWVAPFSAITSAAIALCGNLFRKGESADQNKTAHHTKRGESITIASENKP